MGLLQDIFDNLGLAFAKPLIESRGGVVAGKTLVGFNQAKQSGGVSVPNLQNNPSIPIPEGSRNTVATIRADPIVRTDVSNKRKFNQSSAKPKIQTNFFNPKSGQDGSITTEEKIKTAREKDAERGKPAPATLSSLTPQEREDLQALTNRFNRKSPAKQKVSDSPLQIIGIKRAEEKRAVQNTFDSSTVQNKNFDLGLPSDATESDRKLAIRQQQAQQGVKLKIEQNKILNQQREKTGRQIQSTIAKSGKNQKDFLKSSGIALRGGNLNAKALARLRERGLI